MDVIVKGKQTSKTIHSKIWEAITRGVTEKLDSDSDTIDRWSPNNLRRVVLSPDGVMIQPFVTKGTFYKSPVSIVLFTNKDMQEYSTTNKRAILSFLHRDRVFTSIEEIVIIPKSPNSQFVLSQEELKVLIRMQNSFKRLGSIVLINNLISLKDFVESNSKNFLVNDELLKDKLDGYNSNIITPVKDWYNHTTLRPQFYTLDEEGKDLSNYFMSLKENLANKSKSSVVTKERSVTEEKVQESSQIENIAFSEHAKKALMLAYHQQISSPNSKNPSIRFSLLFENIKVAQNKSELRFQSKEDESINKILRSLQLYSDNATGTEDELLDELKNRSLVTLKKTLADLESQYPVLTAMLKVKLRESLKRVSNEDLNSEVLRDFNKLTTFNYKVNFDYEKVATGYSDASCSEGMLLLVNALSTVSKSELEDVKRVILLDLKFPLNTVKLVYSIDSSTGSEILASLTSTVPGLNAVVLHDMYIYFNKIKHRMYNTLLVPSNNDIKGVVSIQPVVERLEMLANGIDDSSTTDDKDTINSLLNQLQNGEYKRSFNDTKDIVNSYFNESAITGVDGDYDKVLIFKSLCHFLNDLLGKESHKLSLAFGTRNFNPSNKMGSRGITGMTSGDKLIRDLFDSRKEIDEGSVYLKFLVGLVLREKVGVLH